MDFATQAQDSESFCPIYLDIDSNFEGTLNSVKKNLEDNSMSKKKKAMENILMMHLKGEDVSSLLMDIIRFAVPSTDHRIKRLVYLFFQTFDMCKKDGTPREEVILVCNALRNDLNSPNEFVRGSVLRLLSRLTIFNIIQPLIPSIINNVEHREPYVYRNALLCLTNISEQFGSDLVTPSFTTVENFITSTDDVFGTVRAYKLLESCNLDLCIQFILAIEANLLNLSPLIHLAILVSFEKLSSINPEIAQMMMRILTLLLQFSNNNSVLYYSANLLLKYHRNYANNLEDVQVCCKCLIKVMLNESDLNVKMTVLDKLKMIHAKTSSMNMTHVLEDFVNDLLKGLSITNLAVTAKLLSLVLKVATKSNCDMIIESLVRNFIKVDMNYSNQEVANYRSTLLEGLFNMTRQFPTNLLKSVNQLVVYMTHNNELIATQVSLLLYELVKELKGNRKVLSESDKKEVENLLKNIVENLDKMGHKQVLSNCLYVVGEYSKNYEIIYEIYKMLSNKSEKEEHHEKKSIYNVVLADGSYSTTFAGHREMEEEEEGEGLQKLLTKNNDILLYNTLSTAVLKLLYKYLEESGEGGDGEYYGNGKDARHYGNQQDGGYGNGGHLGNGEHSSYNDNQLNYDKKEKNYVEYSSIIIIKLIEMLDKEVYYIKRLKMALVLLLGLLKEKKKYVKLLRVYLNLSSKGDEQKNKKEEEEEYEQFNIDFKLEDFFGSEMTKKEKLETLEKEVEVKLKEEDDEEEEDEEENKMVNDLSTYAKIHQFTSLTDPIYVEGYIKLIGNKLYFNLFIENKSNEVLQNISLDLSTGTNLQLATTRKIMTLHPKGSTRIQVKFRVISTNDETVYGYVYYSTSNTILLQCLTFNPIHISLYEFINPTKISSQLFRTYWSDFEWEHKIKLTNIKVNPKDLLKKIIEKTNMTVINPKETYKNHFSNSYLNLEMEKTSKKEKVKEDYNWIDNSFFSINLFLKTIFEEEAIANMSLVKKPNNTYSGCFRIRSRNQGVALGLGDRIGMVTREIAI